jgi:hypothetical protein
METWPFHSEVYGDVTMDKKIGIFALLVIGIILIILFFFRDTIAEKIQGFDPATFPDSPRPHPFNLMPDIVGAPVWLGLRRNSSFKHWHRGFPVFYGYISKPEDAEWWTITWCPDNQAYPYLRGGSRTETESAIDKVYESCPGTPQWKWW